MLELQQPLDDGPHPMGSPKLASEVACGLYRELGDPGKNLDTFSLKYRQLLVLAVKEKIRTEPREVGRLLEETQKPNFEYEMAQEAARTFAMAHWYRAGMPVFVPTQSLAAALTLTKYPNVTMGEIPLPFDSQMIVLPRPWLPAPFEGLAALWLYRFWAPIADEEGAPVRQGLRVDIVPSDLRAGTLHRYAAENVATELWIESGENVAREGVPVNADELSVMRLCSRLATGLCFYLASLNQWPEPVGRRGKRVGSKRKVVAGGDLSPLIWQVGRDVKLPAALRRAAADFTQSRRGPAAGWKLSRRFTVRGHFKRYIIGKREEGHREWRWVRPFWKGPEEGIALQRTYVVDDVDVFET